MAKFVSENRPLTREEEQLVRWMLEHGKPEGERLFAQLEQARVTPWRCPCGCASLNFAIERLPHPSGALRPVADFVFGDDPDLNGIFVYEQDGILAGIEVYGLSGDAAKSLPRPEALRPVPLAK